MRRSRQSETSRDWSGRHRGPGSGLRAAQVYQQLKAKRFVPATSTITRVTVGPGIDLLVDDLQRLPSRAKLHEVVDLVRAAFGVTEDADRPGVR